MRRSRITLFFIGFLILMSLVVRIPITGASAEFSKNVKLASVVAEAEFRQSLGFKSDAAYIEAVRAAGDSVIVESLGVSF